MNRPKILVVDDHEDFRLLIQTSILAVYPGADIKSAADGQQAMLKIRRWNPDLLILDMVMPKLDGLKLIRKIRCDPSRSELKILAVSGLINGIGSESLACGANAFFRKGTGLQELIKALPDYLPALRSASFSVRLQEDRSAGGII